MPEPNRLTVDFTQESEVLQVLARPPLLTSQDFAWDGIYLQQHRQPAWETPEYAHTRHMLMVHEADCEVQSERVLDGRRQSEVLSSPQVVLVPATVQHQAVWDREGSFTLLFLEPDHLAQVAYEAVNVDRIELIPQFATPDPLIYQIGQALKSEITSNGVGSRLFVDSLTTALSIHLLRSYSTWQQPLQEYRGLSQRKLQQAIDYINDHLDQELSLAAIARELDMSQYYFARLFKQSMGISPYQYVLQQRIERAKVWLKSSALSMSAIAHRVGFADQSQFTVQFRKFTGITPRAYRERL
ncbi:MAG: AraC family transcriptional regulator [Tildeniella nuda ZEHNDER 1965/U140]|jgi:AraC family transcriptional regulator|nr:AraC family transcriptional regulator [Tildeniella nuda ZEHNDER 1965/U140]